MFKDDNLNFSAAHLKKKKLAQALVKQRELSCFFFQLADNVSEGLNYNNRIL